jgi:hypothetical protein
MPRRCVMDLHARYLAFLWMQVQGMCRISFPKSGVGPERLY